MTPMALRPLAFLVAGVLLGLLHFGALRRAVRVRLQGHGPKLGLHSVRFASTITGLLVVARAGGDVALLASFVGFVAARAFVTLPGGPV